MTDTRSNAPGAVTTPLRYAMLALIAEEDCHGYALLRRFEERVGPFWYPNIGQVYQLLRQLERQGLATSRKQHIEEGAGPRARYPYRITEKGRRALRQWLDRRPRWPSPPRGELFVRLLAAEAAGPAAMRTQLDRYATEFAAYHKQLRDHAGLKHPVARLLHEAALMEAATHAEWIDRARTALGHRPAVAS